jgi:predicted permease
MLLKQKGLTSVAIVSLALGIGLNTAIFSVVNAVLIRPLPVVKQQNRLVWLRAPISYPDYLDYRSQAHSFEGMAAITGTQDFSVTSGSEPQLVKGEYVTENYFNLLGVSASLGRAFVEEDEIRQAPVVILSEHLWRTSFASDANIVGRQISLNGFGFTVVGVMPQHFAGTEVGLNRELWLPLSTYRLLNPPATARAADPGSSRFESRDTHWLAVFALLKPDISRESAGSELTGIARRVAENYVGKVDAETLRSVQLLRLSGGMDPRDQEEVLPVAGIAMGVVALVLLIACANIASLLLARAATRRRETAIRQALGASRRRLVRQWLTESVLLGIAGGAVGLILALWANQLLVSRLQSTPLAALDFRLDYRVLAFTLVVSILTGLVFGLAPALQASRLNIVMALKSDALKVAGAHRSYLRNAFVTVQLILSVVLLVGSGLFIRALQRASSIDPGFTVERALLAPINLGLLRYDKTEGHVFYRDLLARIQAQPGVEQATLVRFPPMGSSFAQFEVFREGSESATGMSTGFNVVGPNYFRTMGTALLRGREFTDADRDGAPGTAILNETLAARLWGNQDVLGKRLSFAGPKGPFLEVVGVARDSKYQTLGERPRPYVYLPLSQSYDPKMTLVVRTTGEPKAITPIVREQIRTLNPNLPIADVQTLREQLELTLLPSRIAAWTLGGFGALALLLAGIGIYGVVSYGAAQRTREIGVRMALGAKEKDVLGLVLWDGLIVIGAGLAIGLLLAAAATRVIAAFLYGVGATDPLTFVAVPLLLGVVALVASYVPARRAVRVDPLVALRCE